jgi:acetolactate synthase I/II/III large subunit
MRAAQFAKSEPQGPSYLIASREVLEEKVEPVQIVKKHWKPAAPAGLSPDSVIEIAEALISARNPCVITSYLGREPKAVSELVTLAESLGIAVLEALPGYLNFPHNHDLYMGNHWSEGLKDGTLDSADVVLVLDCDVPWIKGVFRPPQDAKVYHIDTDALKTQMSLFHLPTELSCSVNPYVALQQLNTYIAGQKLSLYSSEIKQRIANLKTRHDAYIQRNTSLEILPTNNDVITPHYVLSRLRHLTPSDTMFLSEGISNYRPVADVLGCTEPGTYFTSGATALGWHGGAAIGAKLANPSKTVVAITGDGSFLFSIPSTVHWMSRRYEAPFLTVILNNRGWKSPMLSAMAVHKDGWSSQMSTDDLFVTFDPPPNHAGVAVAAGAGWGATVMQASEVDEAIKKGLETVKNGRSAVLDIYLPKIVTGDRVG